MNRQVGNLSLLRAQGHAQAAVPRQLSGLSPGLTVLVLAVGVVVLVLALALLGLPLAAPAGLEVGSAPAGAHYAPSCEAAVAISSEPECPLAQWYAASQGQPHTITCMGR